MSKKNGVRSRGWCFTINNYNQADVDAVMGADCDYVICGIEKGEDKETPHLQGYMYWTMQKAFSTIKKLLGRAHIEKAKGTGAENREYCTKEGDILIEKGSMPLDTKAKGAKGQEYWRDVKQKAQAGMLDEIDDKTYVGMYRTLVAISKDHATKHEPLDHTTGEWWYGESGSGKSKTARETYPDAYIKGVNKWWDGYRGEDTVIIEDLDKFNVSIGGDLKRWCDHYSFPAEIKGGGMNIRPKRIIITSQYDINEIWDDQATVDALERRCKKRHFAVLASSDSSSEASAPAVSAVKLVREGADLQNPYEMQVADGEMDWKSYYEM